MRKVANRILSATPMLTIAFLALLAAANPKKAGLALDWVVGQMSDPRFFWLCVALVVAYAALWWATSREPRSRHERLVEEGLRPIFQELQAFRRAIFAATTDDEFIQISDELTAANKQMFAWIEFHMGQGALAKYVGGSSPGMTWNWAGEHDPQTKEKRDNTLMWLGNRITAIEEMIVSDGWDGRGPTRWARLKKWRQERGERSAQTV